MNTSSNSVPSSVNNSTDIKDKEKEEERLRWLLTKHQGGDWSTRELSREIEKTRSPTVPGFGNKTAINKDDAAAFYRAQEDNKPKEPPSMLRAFVADVQYKFAVFGVPLGVGLTTVALGGGLVAMMRGSSNQQQRFMKYRISAQLFTVVALCLGFAGTAVTVDEKRKNR